MVEATYAVPETVVSADLGGEAVLLDTASGQYFGLDETAGEIWRGLTDGRTETEISERIVAAFDVDLLRARDDVRAFIGELEAGGLIRRTA